MKTPFVLSVLCLALVSCAPTPNEPDRPENDLLHSPESETLSVSKPTRTVQSTLVCGCGFVLRVEATGGDPAITYSVPTAAAGDTLTSHNITVSANTTGLASGTYTSWLALYTPYTFERVYRDTIYDTLIVP